MLEFKITYGIDGYMAAKDVREKVFFGEVGFTYDRDEIDEVAYHIVCTEEGTPIAAGRLYSIEEGVFSIGRMAVLPQHRGQYIGDTIMRALEDKAVSLAGRKICVLALASAEEFYKKQGYIRTGEIRLDDGPPHVPMAKDLSKIMGCRGGCCK